MTTHIAGIGPRTARLAGVVIVAAFGMAARSPVAAQSSDAQGRVTFSKHIAPILQRSCQTCHRPGSIAPMSLMTFEEVRPWAKSIKLKTSLREMPPWFIEKNIGIQKFKDDPSLSDEEIATIARWVDSGAPQGNPADLPPRRQFTADDAWTIGKPDLIVSSPVHTLKAVAADFYGILQASPTGLTEDRYIKAIEVKEVRLQTGPSVRRSAGDLNLFVVHHAVISSRSRIDENTPETQTQTTAGRSGGDFFSITYEVGQNATIFPDALGVKLTAGSSVNWDVHLHSVGVDVPLRIDVAFTFHPKGYTPKYTRVGGGGMFPTFDLDIPPGEANVKLEGLYTLPEPAILVTFEPHLHSSGRRMCVEAIYPSGVTEMLNCAGYNHNWVKVYAYADDVAPLLPKGTILRITAWYDNTAKNPRVVDPRNWKGYGNRSIDDMFAFLPRLVRLTEEEFKEAVAARQAKTRAANTTAQQ